MRTAVVAGLRRWLAGPMPLGLAWLAAVVALASVDAGPLLLGLPSAALLVVVARRGDDEGSGSRVLLAGLVALAAAVVVGLVAAAARGTGGSSGLDAEVRIVLAVVVLGLVAVAVRRVPTPDRVGDGPDERVADGVPSEPIGPRG